jgi:hypothetical protein
MLHLPIRFIKDAARSAKRVCLDNFTKAKDSVLTDLLGIPTLIGAKRPFFIFYHDDLSAKIAVKFLKSNCRLLKNTAGKPRL